jgi:hypothetical protein
MGSFITSMDELAPAALNAPTTCLQVIVKSRPHCAKMLGVVRPAHVLALAIVLFGSLLRLDAFVGKYGTLDHPAWARIATQQIAPRARTFVPAEVRWSRELRPYVGGDPINYLAYAREMVSFYQPHVREPVFLAWTRLALWSLDGQDAAVSLASALGSVLAVLATYLLGAALISPATGLLASLLLAIEFEVITWAPDGWRDDMFMATVVLAAWALVRLQRAPSFSGALLAGALCGVACLTRITALAFVLPAFVWLLADAAPEQRRTLWRHVLVAFLIAAALVAPFLISSAIATGDPLYALNYHTGFYRHAEGLDTSTPMTARQYVTSHLATLPVATGDTGFIGLFVQPFVTKWNGFVQWISGLGALLRLAALAGLGAMLFTRGGRLLILILLASILPYAFTWHLPGGGEWRFTLPAYPIYLTASAVTLTGLFRVANRISRGIVRPSRDAVRLASRRVAVVAVIAAVGTSLYFGLPWFVAKESIASGRSTSIDTGDRDRVFYRGGWSAPRRDGITARVSVSERSSIHIPLPQKRAYELLLRLDPVAPDAQQRISVLFNGTLVGRMHLGWDPSRVGSYRIVIPADAAHAGSNELVLIPEPTIAAGQAGPLYSSIPAHEQIGVRVWYVRVLS